MKRIKAVAGKEFLHIVRDPKSLIIVFVMPVLMIFIYGYAISFDLNRIESAIIDLDRSEQSQKLIEKIVASRYFQVRLLNCCEKSTSPFAEAERLLRSSEIKEYLVIPADFSQKLADGLTAELGVVIDGSDSNLATIVYNYNERIISAYLSGVTNLEQIIRLSTKIFFNPEMKNSNFFIPGLIAILLLMISALLTSLSVAREKESCSIELLFISPLKSREIILSKAFPYVFVALGATLLIVFFARFWFQIPFRGSLFVLLCFSLLYVITGRALGILVSTIVSEQRTAMFAALLTTLLPSIMLSGFIFPIESMGIILQAISRIVPATYFLRIIRGVIFKGTDLSYFIPEGIALILFAIILLKFAVVRFETMRRRGR